MRLKEQQGAMWFAAIVGLILSVICIRPTHACEMLPSASQFFSAQFETGRRGEIKSLDKIEVSAYFNNIVDNACAENLELMMLLPDETWKTVDVTKQNKRDRTKKRESYFLWKVSSMIPCRTNKFRLVIGKEFIETELASASLGDMEDLEYNPGKPENIKYGNNELTWNDVECATSYKIDIINYGTGDEVKKESVNENAISLDDLEHCEEFEYLIFPYVGEFESIDDEENGEFTKEPNLDALYDLEIRVEALKETVLISWEMSKEISCVDKYSVEVCDVNDDATKCETGIVYDTLEDSSMFNVPISGLKQATRYQVALTAFYRGDQYYKEIKTQFNTLLDIEQFKVAAVADFETATIIWSNVAIATSYTVYRQYEHKEWVPIANVTADDLTFQSEEQPCINIAYAVAVITSEITYDKKASTTVNLKLDDSQPFLPAHVSTVTGADGASLSWSHLSCIDAYEVNICDELDCSTTTTTAAELLENDAIAYEVTNLTPCTTYQVDVYPMIAGHTWSGEPLAQELTTGLLLTPPEEESFQVQPWTPHTPVFLAWDNTSCAESYELFIETTDNPGNYFYKTVVGEVVELEDQEVESCTEYKFQIVSLAGQNRSDDSSVGYFMIGPTKASLQEIQPNIQVGKLSADISIPLNRETACIELFELSICNTIGECPVTEDIHTNGDTEVKFSSEDLETATDYIVTILPLYKGEPLQTQEEAFRKDISTMMDLDGVTLSAFLVPEEHNMVQVEWTEVVGAEEYQIYQEYRAEQDSEMVLRTAVLSGQLEQGACSTATYILNAVRHGQVDLNNIHSQEVTSLLNDTEPYLATNLNIDHKGSVTTLTWDHLGPCIHSYSLILSNGQGGETDLSVAGPGEGDLEVTVSVNTLETCKEYSLTIVPVFITGLDWRAEPEVQKEIKQMNKNNCVVQKVPRHAMKQKSSSSSCPKRLLLLPLSLVFLLHQSVHQMS